MDPGPGDGRNEVRGRPIRALHPPGALDPTVAPATREPQWPRTSATCKTPPAKPRETAESKRIDDRWLSDLPDQLGGLGLTCDEIPVVRDGRGLIGPSRERSTTHHADVGL